MKQEWTTLQGWMLFIIKIALIWALMVVSCQFVHQKKIGYRNWDSVIVYRDGVCYEIFINGSRGIVAPCEEEE